jgi:hypothetical protein
MAFLGVSLVIVFVELILALFAGFVPDAQALPSPAKLFLIFQLPTVVTFFLCHEFLL